MAQQREEDWDRPTGLTCKTCGTRIVEMPDQNTGGIILDHARPWDDYDHDAYPVPEAVAPLTRFICDFCTSPTAKYQYLGKPVQTLGPFATDQDGIWAACDDCDPYVRRGDVKGLERQYQSSNHVRESSKWADAQRGLTRDEARRFDMRTNPMHVSLRRQMWSDFMASRPTRRVIPKPVKLPPVKPASMPKVRDRLLKFWHDGTAHSGAFTEHERMGFTVLPGMLCGDPDSFLGKVYQLTNKMVSDQINHLCLGLEAAELYYVSGTFTNLAVTAAKSLPDLTIHRDELPSDHGFLVWQEPIYELHNDVGFPVPVTAVSWTIIPQGVWMTAYADPINYVTGSEPQITRDTLGFFVPASFGGALMFGDHEADSSAKFFAAVLATWFLMKQPGVADQVTEQTYPSLRKQYKKQGRREPTVHVVSIRRAERSARSSEQSTRNYTHAFGVGLRTGGFWRTYWTGSGRAVRDRRWIAPYIARADLPMKKEDRIVPTVKVLR